ncbi:hypothetical protein ALC56_05906 [Trachymyrmex septentrionalis]|uniref:Phospholipase A2-like domain-containing protein n=1 Tax=Trachymyrmex septentrionalis TaxID=34720 RepID=A0A151JX62_9HYME|nr:hypothetical protein ALC56_05906 [Trachymyrmex septentrionalis]
MFFLLTDTRGILDFTAEQLQYISKIILLQEIENYVELWDRLPEHLKTDCGLGTHLAKRLTRGDRSVNRLDAACRKHDIAYSRSTDLADRHIADRVLAERARERITASDSTFGEKAAATAVWAAMKVKTKLGMGKRRKKTKRKKLLPVMKRGEFLLILPMLSAFGSLIGGAASVARAVSDRKAA